MLFSSIFHAEFKISYPFEFQNQNFEPQHEISNNVVCATSKGSDQPRHMCSLIRAFPSHLTIL